MAVRRYEAPVDTTIGATMAIRNPAVTALAVTPLAVFVVTALLVDLFRD
jgi:hypothetical protein